MRSRTIFTPKWVQSRTRPLKMEALKRATKNGHNVVGFEVVKPRVGVTAVTAGCTLCGSGITAVLYDDGTTEFVGDCATERCTMRNRRQVHNE